MCGIVGMAGELDGKTDKALKTLLILDSLRGEDSTGVVSVGRHNDDVVMAKQLGVPFELFEHRSYPAAINKRTNRVVIGHNRYATSGGVSRATAHPFEFDTLVGVHNGTLHNKHVLADEKDFKVDSENLYHHIEKHGLDAAMKLVRGAWALVWWDKIESTLNFLRNKERPLYYTVNDKGDQLFWASESWMLEVALPRAEIKHKDIVLFEEDFLHSVPIPRGGKLGKPILRKIENAPPLPSTTVYPIRGQGSVFPRGTPASTTPSRGSDKSPDSKTTTAVATLDRPDNAKIDSRSRVDAKFMQAKNITFEAVVLVKEKSGAEFILCFHPDKPFYEIRLYVNRHHAVAEDMGCEFEGDISGFVQTDSMGIGYYKISPHGITITTPCKHHNPDEQEYLGHEGKYLSKKDWEARYGTCAFCSDNIEADDMMDGGARITQAGDSLCGGCMQDEEISAYVKTVSPSIT